MMGNPVVHFEVTGEDPDKLRSFYGGLFGWEFDTSAPVAPVISGTRGLNWRSATSPIPRVT
jgi:predicted enzyme related to lactoylglutathione lyase